MFQAPEGKPQMNESKGAVASPINRDIWYHSCLRCSRGSWSSRRGPIPSASCSGGGRRDIPALPAKSTCAVGGVFSLKLRGPDGTVYPCTGVFREVVRPEKIVYTGPSEKNHPCGAGLPPNAIVTVNFVEHDRKTTLTIHTRLESASDRDAAVDAGFVPGWASTLDRLADFLPTA